MKEVKEEREWKRERWTESEERERDRKQGERTEITMGNRKRAID